MQIMVDGLLGIEAITHLFDAHRFDGIFHPAYYSLADENTHKATQRHLTRR